MKEWYVDRYHCRPLPTLFLTLMLACVFLTFVITLAWNEYPIHVLGKMGQHVFMDYFWSVCDSINDPYSTMKVIYPPFIVVIYSIIGHISEPFVTQDTGDIYIDMFNSQIPMMIFAILMGISIYLFLTVCRKALAGTLEETETKLFLFAILISFPLLIALQNGNSIIYSISFLTMFLLGYRSEKKWVRYCSYICIGIVAGMKLSPAMFALLILRERRYKEFIICGMIICVIAFAPIIFTDGTIAMMIENLFALDRETGGSVNNIPKLFYFMAKDLNMPVLDTVGAVVTEIVTVLTMIIMVLDTKMKQWKVIALAAMCIITGFGIGTPYLYMYVIVAVLFFLREEKEATRANLFYLIMLALPIMLISMDVLMLKVWATLFLFFTLLVLGVIDLLKMYKEADQKDSVKDESSE